MRKTLETEITLDLSRHTLAFLVALAPILAVAQAEDEPGLDLSESSPAASRKRAPAPAPTPASTPKEQVASPIAPGEKDVALGDRVKAVQRKGFLKRHRLELGADLPASINDAFYEKFGVGGRLGYNVADSLALTLRGVHYWQVRSSHVRQGKIAFASQILVSQLYNQAMLDAVWSPIYGKIAWMSKSIVHFDVNVLAGGGLVWTATGKHAAADLGGGVRFYPNDWLALEGGLVATMYSDQPNSNVPPTVQKVFTARFGVTFFIPTSFDYVYP